MRRGLGFGRGMVIRTGATSYDAKGGKVSTSAEHVAAVVAALIRPGGRTPPVWVFCPKGHDTGTKLRFRLADGVPEMQIDGTVTGSVYQDDEPTHHRQFTPGSPDPEVSPAWSVHCHSCGETGSVRSGNWIEQQALETIKRWVDDGRPGPMRFRWT